MFIEYVNIPYTGIFDKGRDKRDHPYRVSKLIKRDILTMDFILRVGDRFEDMKKTGRQFSGLF